MKQLVIGARIIQESTILIHIYIVNNRCWNRSLGWIKCNIVICEYFCWLCFRYTELSLNIKDFYSISDEIALTKNRFISKVLFKCKTTKNVCNFLFIFGHNLPHVHECFIQSHRKLDHQFYNFLLDSSNENK